MNEAYLCLGGNLGNCIETFTKALVLLGKNDVSATDFSSIYISGAWGMEAAPDFHNQVLAVKTSHSAHELMKILLEIEKNLGKERKEPGAYQSRTIDIDILFFNEKVIDSLELQVPHPRLHLRRFVLEPLNEIAPNFIHPILKKSVSQLLKVCEDKSTIKKSEHAV